MDSISEQIKITPLIADGVNEANTKLDELSKISSRLDRFDNIADAQANAAMNTFIYQLLGGNISRYDPYEYEQIVQLIKVKTNDFLNREVLCRLSEDALNQVYDFMDRNPGAIDDLVVLIQQKAVECNLDLDTITFNAMARLAEGWKSAFGDNFNPDDFYDPKPKNEEPAMITGDDVANMSETEFDDWINDLLDPEK